jgi:serine/threonine-protein kinase
LLRAKERELRAQFKDYESAEKKKPLWDTSEKATAAEHDSTQRFSQTTAAYLAVLNVVPMHCEARGELSALFYERFLTAESRGYREATALYEGLTRQYHDGRYDVELAGMGELRLDSDPEGAEVELCRFVEKGPLLVESDHEKVGRTPIVMDLKQGSYLGVLRADGYEIARYPFVIDRGQRQVGTVRLREEGTIPDGFIFVPGGETIVGGSEVPSLEGKRIFIDDLFMARFPVTFEDYREFLNDEFPADDPDLDTVLLRWGSETYLQRDADGVFQVNAELHPKMPAFGMTYRATGRYCSWLGNKLRRVVRIPREEEWERCARGADGRIFPWGNGLDWSFFKGGLSRKGNAQPEPVGEFPTDVSVFGVRELAGGVREFCTGEIGDGVVPHHGGSWFQVSLRASRADFRQPVRDKDSFTEGSCLAPCQK